MVKNSVNKKKHRFFGPFQIRPDRSGDILRSNVNDFWNTVLEKTGSPDLSHAHGCYVFGMKYGKKSTPWYVGKAAGSFGKDCFRKANVRIYEKCLREHPGATFLMFLPAATRNKNTLDKLETILCTMAYLKNSGIRNIEFVRLLNKAIPGVLTGRRSFP